MWSGETARHYQFTLIYHWLGKNLMKKTPGEGVINKMGEGEKKFKEIGEKLKADKQVAQEAEESKIAEVKAELARIQDDPELRKLYADSANLGSENLAKELPQLKIHTANKSEGNELADGTEPNNGWFFYKPTQEQFKELNVHILTISRGFRAEGLSGKQDVFNQIMAGVIIEGNEYRPFMMYFSGVKLSRLWEFGKEAKKYTRAKPVAIPMFALTVRLTVGTEQHSMGKSFVVDFEILKNPDGSPKLVTDPGEFVYLRDHVSDVALTIDSVIEKKESGQRNSAKASSVKPVAEAVEGEPVQEDVEELF